MHKTAGDCRDTWIWEGMTGEQAALWAIRTDPDRWAWEGER